MSRTIAIGPYHPYLLEPELFELETNDDIVTGVKITVGYVNRAVEELMTKKTYKQDVFLAERICGICSNHHTLCFCQAAEKIMDIEVPERADAIRTIFAELERLHSHFLWLGLMSHALEDGKHFARIMVDRETLIRLLEKVSGNRVHYGVSTIGGVRRDLTPDLIPPIQEVLEKLKPLADFCIEALGKNGALGSRLAGLGIVSGEEALSLGTVGPALRGSGVASDIRKDEPYAAYGRVRFNVITEVDADTRARSIIRARETAESISIIEQLLNNLPDGPIMGILKEPFIKDINKEVFQRVEPPRGELVYYIKSNGTNMPERVKVRTPTYANLRFLARALEGEKVDKVRFTIESIDPCFSCTDR